MTGYAETVKMFTDMDYLTSEAAQSPLCSGGSLCEGLPGDHRDRWFQDTDHSVSKLQPQPGADAGSQDPGLSWGLSQ